LLYASNAVSDLIMTGVLEPYPRLKFVLVENEVSWIPFLPDAVRQVLGSGESGITLTMFPSECFNRQFYAKFFNDPPARWIFDTWVSNNLVWSNDYPHPNSTWPKSWRCHLPGLGSPVGEDALTAPARERTTVVQLASAERGSD
jgi:hypothetical protein